MSKHLTIQDVLQGQYQKINSKNRLTSNREFNQDAEIWIGIKEMMIVINQRVRDFGNGNEGRRLKFKDVVYEYAKEWSVKTRIKTWGK